VLLLLRVAVGLHEERRSAAAATRGDAVDHMPWRTLEAGLAEARTRGMPILYDFTADWCPPCRRMQRELFADPRVAAELSRSFVPVRVLDRVREEGRNAAWVDSLQRHFRVRAFPTLVIVRPDGGPPVRIQGYPGRTFTLSRIEDARARLRVPGIVPPAESAR
jgi:uncharacterized protein YyaL (SSP411 family)